MHDIMFLGAFSKLEKVTISFIVCCSLSVYSSIWNDSVPTGRIFMKFDIRVFFEIPSTIWTKLFLIGLVVTNVSEIHVPSFFKVDITL